MKQSILTKLSPKGREEIIQLEARLGELELQINELNEEMPTL